MGTSSEDGPGGASHGTGGTERASWGIVRQLVDRNAPRPATRTGIVHVGRLATICTVEEIPAVGDRIEGDVPAVVEKVRLTRAGTVLVYARAVGVPPTA